MYIHTYISYMLYVKFFSSLFFLFGTATFEGVSKMILTEQKWSIMSQTRTVGKAWKRHTKKDKNYVSSFFNFAFSPALSSANPLKS